jgi:hypothetical protein
MNLARECREDFQLVLTRYGLERLLYRLAQSPHASEFVLKGAALFQNICSLSVADDGLMFLTDAIQAEQIKGEDEYQGIRLRIEARLGNARLPLQIDIGFGDAITPGPLVVTYPTLLEFPAPQLNAYPRETVVAEKFQAMRC